MTNTTPSAPAGRSTITIDADTDVTALIGRRFTATWRGQRNEPVIRDITIQTARHSDRYHWIGANAIEWDCPCNAMHPGGGHATALALEYGHATLEPVD